jgi:hypothetical protein
MVASISGWDKKRQRSTFTPAAPDMIEHSPRLPTHDEIQLRAFEIYERGGRQDGQTEENWLEAERELLAECRLEEQDAGLVSSQRPPSAEF